MKQKWSIGLNFELDSESFWWWCDGSGGPRWLWGLVMLECHFIVGHPKLTIVTSSHHCVLTFQKNRQLIKGLLLDTLQLQLMNTSAITLTSSSSSRGQSTLSSLPSASTREQVSVTTGRARDRGAPKGSMCLHHLSFQKVSAEDLDWLPFCIWVISIHMVFFYYMFIL